VSPGILIRVILSGADTSRSEVSAESKDPYTASVAATAQGSSSGDIALRYNEDQIKRQ